MADFRNGDYDYTIIDIDNNYVKAKVWDRNKVQYEVLHDIIEYNGIMYTLTSMAECFMRCPNFNQSITIPNSVISMNTCFYGCTSFDSLVTFEENSQVTNMNYCFGYCTSFDKPIEIPDSVTNMSYCFRGCTSFDKPITIPDSVTDMGNCFSWCTSLVNAPIIPNNVENMSYCFAGCRSLSGDIYIYTTYDSLSYSQCFYDTSHTICLHAMNNNIEKCDALASTANNNNVYVNVKPETALNFNNTQVNYLNQNSEFVALSMQTNANLIQCRIPKLSGGEASIITTNLNDALIDLYKRKVGGA